MDKSKVESAFDISLAKSASDEFSPSDNKLLDFSLTIPNLSLWVDVVFKSLSAALTTDIDSKNKQIKQIKITLNFNLIIKTPHYIWYNF